MHRAELLRGSEVLQTWQVAEAATKDADSPEDGVLLRVLWGGTERKGTARLQRVHWDGSLTVKGGELEWIEDVNRQSFADWAEATDSRRVQWKSATAGNAAGVVVRVRGDEATVLEFRSEPATFEVALPDVRDSEYTFDAGGVGRFAKIGPAPRVGGPSKFEARWVDTNPPSGVAPYWLRVTQVDQAMAWSSPVYVSHS